ncbi:hypothetical protein WN55_09657 [Dufourea novaeangliae]|uniref:Uncharacterized protein n=1 Tax=Dufourea novaeangliae TaxID=178035 RepID=A0A154P0T7_DUFNO|nr:hypothetical protein WN55_09657 [Dufourea novaeangliae]
MYSSIKIDNTDPRYLFDLQIASNLIMPRTELTNELWGQYLLTFSSRERNSHMGIAEPLTQRVWHPSIRTAAKITKVLELLIVGVSLLFLSTI